jgi:hypothetical protein
MRALPREENENLKAALTMAQDEAKKVWKRIQKNPIDSALQCDYAYKMGIVKGLERALIEITFN